MVYSGMAESPRGRLGFLETVRGPALARGLRRSRDMTIRGSLVLALALLSGCLSSIIPMGSAPSGGNAGSGDATGGNGGGGSSSGGGTSGGGSSGGDTAGNTGTGTGTGTGGGGGTGGSVPVGGTPGGFKSPVYFMPLDAQPQNITEAIQATGNKSFLLAFVLDSGGCTPAWNGQTAHPVSSDTTVADVVNAARAAGADVGVSFGGYNGTELGQSCGSPSALAAAYQAVIDKYKLTHIDLDVENTALGDVANETKRFTAIKMLQDAATAAGRSLSVSVTLPVTTIGLSDSGKEELRAAIAVGARIDIINIMDFDYGLSAGATQADSAISIAEAAHTQLKALFPAWSDADAYAHLGLQLMNGHSDQPSELFTLDTFRTMLAYAQQKHLGWFANWALNRDRPCDPSVPHNWAEGYCSSVDQKPYDFTKIVAQYGG